MIASLVSHRLARDLLRILCSRCAVVMQYMSSSSLDKYWTSTGHILDKYWTTTKVTPYLLRGKEERSKFGISLDFT